MPDEVNRARALQHCTVVRPEGFAGAVEIVRGYTVAREFPVQVNDTFGVCLKFGRDHAVTSDGRALRYPADSLCVRSPGCVWSCEPAAVGFLSIDLAPHALPEDLRRSPMRFLPPSAALDLRRTAVQLCASDALLREQALAELIVALVTAGAAHGARSLTGEAPIRKARQRLADDLDAALSLDQLAHELRVNKFVLIRRFREQTGTTPHRYRTLLRIVRAKQLLSRGGEPADVAHAVGFADQSHLSRVFKRSVGVTPRSYAKATRFVASLPAQLLSES